MGLNWGPLYRRHKYNMLHVSLAKCATVERLGSFGVNMFVVNLSRNLYTACPFVNSKVIFIYLWRKIIHSSAFRWRLLRHSNTLVYVCVGVGVYVVVTGGCGWNRHLYTVTNASPPSFKYQTCFSLHFLVTAVWANSPNSLYTLWLVFVSINRMQGGVK